MANALPINTLALTPTRKLVRVTAHSTLSGRVVVREFHPRLGWLKQPKACEVAALVVVWQPGVVEAEAA